VNSSISPGASGTPCTIRPRSANLIGGLLFTARLSSRLVCGLPISQKLAEDDKISRLLQMRRTALLFAVLSVDHTSAFSGSPAHRARLTTSTTRAFRQPTAFLQETSAVPLLATPVTPGWDSSTTLLADGGFIGAIFGALGNIVGGVFVVALVLIPLFYIYGVFIISPEEREEQGIGKLLTDLTYAYTPSPWRKSYLAGTEEEEKREPLDLPDWASEEATLVTEPECVVGVQAMQRMQLSIPSLGAGAPPINACYWSAHPAPEKRVDAPPVLLVHGFDSSVLEFRFVLPKLVEAGLEVRLSNRIFLTPSLVPMAGCPPAKPIAMRDPLTVCAMRSTLRALGPHGRLVVRRFHRPNAIRQQAKV
jgi:hypothetical protein